MRTKNEAPRSQCNNEQKQKRSDQEKGEELKKKREHMMKRPVFEMYKGHSASLYRSGCVHRIIFDATAHYVLFIRKQ